MTKCSAVWQCPRQEVRLPGLGWQDGVVRGEGMDGFWSLLEFALTGLEDQLGVGCNAE